MPEALDLYCDSHIHTRLCGHATGEMEEYVQSAIAKGLRKIIFLEHMEEGILCHSDTWLSEDAFDYYFSEGRRLQDLYGRQLEIGLGVECGFNADRAGTLRTRLKRRQWDCIGVSCHFLKLPGMREHLNLFSRKEENTRLARQFQPEMLLDLYFRTLHEAVRQLPGTMLCHLDGALRFVPETTLTEAHYRLIEQLLQTVSKKGMALELNTSGITIRREPFPTGRILSLALAYNIPLILGSDAHRPADVARHFADICRFIPSESCP
ncbi:MAG: hypothetical protein VR65_25625 [Desulfobulbaceae bacterium BRH_c16a]|nr:MAG: hypothetical protein VR65_25625 [Desulfobulbaceae bacterium BRH_c16a]